MNGRKAHPVHQGRHGRLCYYIRENRECPATISRTAKPLQQRLQCISSHYSREGREGPAINAGTDPTTTVLKVKPLQQGRQ